MKRILVIIFLAIPISLFAQPYVNDSIWALVFEDEFYTIDSSKWNFEYPWGTHDNQNPCGFTRPFKPISNYNKTRNHFIDGDTMNLRSLDIRPDFQLSSHYVVGGTEWYHDYFTTGILISKRYFKYGYIEMKCKLPNTTDMRYVTSEGMSACFWMFPFYVPDSVLDPFVSYSEIDIFEFQNNDPNRLDSNIRTANVHYQDTIRRETIPGNWQLRTAEGYEINKTEQPIIFDTYHIFGCEWDPNYIAFYVDNQLVYKSEVKDSVRENQRYIDRLNPMNIMIGTGVGATDNMGDSIRSNTLFPYDFKVDYVRVYQRKMDCDDNFVSTCGGTDYNNCVKKTIKLSGNVPSNSNYTFVATDYIELSPSLNIPVVTNTSFEIDNCIQNINNQ